MRTKPTKEQKSKWNQNYMKAHPRKWKRIQKANHAKWLKANREHIRQYQREAYQRKKMEQKMKQCADERLGEKIDNMLWHMEHNMELHERIEVSADAKLTEFVALLGYKAIDLDSMRVDELTALLTNSKAQKLKQTLRDLA